MWLCFCQGAAWLFRVQRGSIGSALACCMAGPSSNSGSALQGGFFPQSETSNEEKERDLGEWMNECINVNVIMNV
jgi:hypothetical protein